MRIQLPNGLLDGVDLFNFAFIDELRGKQQNYLADRSLVINNIGHVQKILQDMLLSLENESGLKWQGKIEEAVQKLSSGDIETILVKVRENTFGPRYFHEAKCSHCGHHHKHMHLDLSKLDLDVMPHQDLINPVKVLLPKSGLEIVARPQFLKDLLTLVHIANGEQGKLVTEGIKLSIKTINGSADVKSEDLENLPSSDLYFLAEELGKHKLEGTIDTIIEIKCAGCSEEFKVKLNCLNPDFFSHTGDIMSMNI